MRKAVFLAVLLALLAVPAWAKCKHPGICSHMGPHLVIGAGFLWEGYDEAQPCAPCGPLPAPPRPNQPKDPPQLFLRGVWPVAPKWAIEAEAMQVWPNEDERDPYTVWRASATYTIGLGGRR
jgi:hypothetical protein